VGSVDMMEVDEEVKEERLAATPRDMPYPISEEEKTDGWDTLINKCWLKCNNRDCERWRNVPKAIHDEVSCVTASHPSLRCPLHRWRVLGGNVHCSHCSHGYAQVLTRVLPRICVYAGDELCWGVVLDL
jgi:hypothetical protein